jgi:orotate phosphoribosyltransferase
MTRFQKRLRNRLWGTASVFETDVPNPKNDWLLETCERISHNGNVLESDMNPDLRPHFLLASGLHTNILFQFAVAMGYLEVSHLVGYRLFRLIQTHKSMRNPDVLLAIPMGGLPVVYAVQKFYRHRKKKPRVVFPDRDARGEMKFSRGFKIKPDERVVLVEDIITTGGSVQRVLKVISNECNPVGMVAGLDRRPEDSIQLKHFSPVFPMRAALRIPTRVWTADACPYPAHPLIRF